MIETLQQLKGDFVLLDLGSAHSGNLLSASPELASAVTLVEVDPQAPTADGTVCHRRICLPRAVAGTPGPRTFKHRAFPEGSSFLDPRPDLLRDYGLERYFDLVREEEIECETLPGLLAAQGIPRVDLFKTDLEGLDFEVIRSAPDLVRAALVLQCELRFQPFFEGEAEFTEVTGHLRQQGFELIWIRPQIWKYATPGRDQARAGRLVWADACFFLSPSGVRKLDLGWKAFAKQILLAKLLGLENYAEHLYAGYQSSFTPSIRQEIGAWVRPRPALGRRLARGIRGLPGGWMLLSVTRRFFLRCARQAALFKDPVIGHLDL